MIGAVPPVAAGIYAYASMPRPQKFSGTVFKFNVPATKLRIQFESGGREGRKFFFENGVLWWLPFRGHGEWGPFYFC